MSDIVATAESVKDGPVTVTLVLDEVKMVVTIPQPLADYGDDLQDLVIYSSRAIAGALENLHSEAVSRGLLA